MYFLPKKRQISAALKCGICQKTDCWDFSRSPFQSAIPRVWGSFGGEGGSTFKIAWVTFPFSLKNCTQSMPNKIQKYSSVKSCEASYLASYAPTPWKSEINWAASCYFCWMRLGHCKPCQSSWTKLNVQLPLNHISKTKYCITKYITICYSTVDQHPWHGCSRHKDNYLKG